MSSGYNSVLRRWRVKCGAALAAMKDAGADPWATNDAPPPPTTTRGREEALHEEPAAVEVTSVSGLRFARGFPPGAHFRFESPVRLGAVNVHPGVTIGRHTYVNGGEIRSYSVIGRYCSIGRNVTLGTGTHNKSLLSTSPFLAGGSKVEMAKWVDRDRRIAVEVGNDVWVGDKVVVMRGVRVGHGAIVGAGAVVTKDVKPYAIVGGVPARVIGMRFPPEMIGRLLASKWWDRDPRFLRTLDIDDLDACLEALEREPWDANEKFARPNYRRMPNES